MCFALINSKGENNATAAAAAEEADGEDTFDNTNANQQAQGVDQPPENTGGNPLQPATANINPGTGMDPLLHPQGEGVDQPPQTTGGNILQQTPENTGGNPSQPTTANINPATGMNPLSYPPGSSEDGSPSKGTAIDVEAQRNRKRPRRGFCGRIDCPAWYKWMSYYIPILEWLPRYDCISSC